MLETAWGTRAITGAAAGLNWCLAELSVHPSANYGPPRCNNNRASGNRGSHDHGASWGGGDAACAIDAARADDGACFHRAESNEASCQR